MGTQSSSRDPAAMREFVFEFVTLDRTGQAVCRESGHAQEFVELLPGDVSLEMVAVVGGSFSMGSRPGEGHEDERPQHAARVRDFSLGKAPVTQAQWESVMGSLPRCRGQGALRPVDRVSWQDAAAFCRRLTGLTGRAYRLPSEAEWEYACRAGTWTPFYTGETITTDVANYVGDHTYAGEPPGVYRHGSTDVGSFAPNPFGLYDMHGNVWEWCADAWHDDYTGAPADGAPWSGPAGADRVLRGGCWHDTPGLCRSAARLRSLPGEGEDYFGFRVAL